MPKKSEPKSYAGSSVFCRMSPAEKDLIERALEKRAQEVPEATWTAGKVMVNLAVKWAKEVLGEK